MLHPKSSFELSHTVASIMEDIWHSRQHLRDRTYLVFRLEASNFESDTNACLFVHYLVTKDRWYAKVDASQFDVTIEDLTARLPDEELAEKSQVQSWRHYAFQDLVQTYVLESLNAAVAAAGIKNVDQFTIWDTFPARQI